MKNSPYYLSLLFLSAALLSLEISLMRMLRVEGFGNFTYGAIALALTGFGASGTFLSIFRKRIKKREIKLSYWSIVLFIFFLGLGFYGSKHVQFDSLRILWDRNQILRLIIRYLFYTIPFIIGSSFVVLAFMIGTPGKVYFFNLFGSGLGICVILISFYLITPRRILIVPLGLASISILLFLISLPSLQPWHSFALPLVVGGIILFWFGDIKILPFKGRELALNLPDSHIISRRISPFGTIEVIESEKLRIAPGLSYSFDGKLPKQHGLYIDGDLLSAIDNVKGDLLMEYLQYQTQAAVYKLHRDPEVFIIGLGGGTSVERAHGGRARRITVSEKNPYLSWLLQERLRFFTGGFFNRKSIVITPLEGRSFLSTSDKKWDIIDIAQERTATSIGGIYSTDTNFDLTVDAFIDYLHSIKNSGTISATVPLKQPPRNLLKLVATAVEACREMGIPPERSIVIIRSWASGTILLKQVSFSTRELVTIKSFCEAMFFDLVYYPGMSEDEANKYNIVENAIYYGGSKPIIEGKNAFMKNYVFNIKPATDDKPYFSYFFRIGKMPYLFRETGKRWLFIVEGGYVVLFATFLATIVISAIFILLPPFFWGRRIEIKKVQVLLYFSGIAVAFMFIEILLMQKYRQYIANPLYSNSMIIASLLIFSGIASYCSDFVVRKKHILLIGLIFLSLYFALHLFFFDQFILRIVGTSKLLQLSVPVLATAPLGLVMGLFFPMGMSGLKRQDVSAIPWAWSVNGFFSVMASSGTVLVASNIGLLSTGFIALFFYWIALLFFPE